MKTILKWTDRNLWFVPVIGTIFCYVILLAWSMLDSDPILLAAAGQSTRLQIYSSLTSSSGSLLGFTIAAVTVLAAFGQVKVSDKEQQATERKLGSARILVSGALLLSAFLLLIVLLISTILLGVDTGVHGPEQLIGIDLSCAAGATIGLVFGGAGLALAIIERNRNSG